MSGDGFENGGAQAARGEAIDFMRLGARCCGASGGSSFRRWPRASLRSVVVTVISPRYTGVAKVLLENQESYFTRADKASADRAPISIPKACRARPKRSPPPNSRAKRPTGSVWPSGTNSIRRARAIPWRSRSRFSPAAGGAGKPEDRVVDAFLARLTVFPVAKSRVLQIEFVSADPALAARGANTVAALYLAEQEQ